MLSNGNRTIDRCGLGFIGKFCWILGEGFLKLTDLIGGSDYLTIGLAGLVTRSLIKHCSIYIEGENELIAIAAEEILETIRNYETKLMGKVCYKKLMVIFYLIICSYQSLDYF